LSCGGTGTPSPFSTRGGEIGSKPIRPISIYAPEIALSLESDIKPKDGYQLEAEHDRQCRLDQEDRTNHRADLPRLTEAVLRSYQDRETCSHVDDEPIPSRSEMIALIGQLQRILFPGYFDPQRIDAQNLPYTMGHTISQTFDQLAVQISSSIRHDCFRYDLSCQECQDRGFTTAKAFLAAIPKMRLVLATDVAAAYEGDPAAKSTDEIIFSYPGLYAIMVYRLAHELFELKVPLLPRMMTEYAHSLTGIDIHPGAQIGERFVIDHGTGVVVGETTRIGNNVRIYQGVTLGALSLSREMVGELRGRKRHPTIEDDVIIYSGTTILGGETVIGARSVIGGNVWLTRSVPPDTQVLMKDPELIYR
jgi:serine O-acetyltransferase